MQKSEIKPNARQQECIDNINGKYLVLAGPGTGKTFTVINRIVNMIRCGVDAKKILCLTFTEAAANEMKTRLDDTIGVVDSGVNIYTYHGFCYELIEKYPEEFELPDNFRIITEAVARTFVKECIDEINPKAFRTEKNDPYYYLKIILNQINEIKKYRLNKDSYFENLKKNQDWYPALNKLQLELEEKLKAGVTRVKTLTDNIKSKKQKIEKAEELWLFYELYSQKMQKGHYLDFNDMISLVLDKFEGDAGFLEKVANDYEYILVDEYQDTNNAQNAIVFNLTRALKSENVFVVGDDDQIIYTFQGARLDNIENFLEEFPETKVICLSENMRSTQSILDVARLVARQDVRRLEDNPKFKQYNIDKELVAKNPLITPFDKKVRCYKYVDTEQEFREIVREIDEIVNSEFCPKDSKGNKLLSEIAILTRTNSELEVFAGMLKDRNIPYELKEGQNIFNIKAFIAMYYYMQLLTNPELHSDRVFKLLLLPPFSVNPKDYETIFNARSKHRAFVDAMRAINPEEFVEPQKIQGFISTFDYLQKYRTCENLKNTILEIGSKTGIFDYYLNADINRAENIAAIKKLVEEAVEFSSINKSILLDDFVQYLDISLEEEIDIKTDKAPVPFNAVQLSTYYSAKGREFEYVYMPTLLRNKWETDNKSLAPTIPLPNSEFKSEAELKELKLADRIKVMYVGMTRAKHTLRLSYVSNVNGKLRKPSSIILNVEELLEREEKPFEYDEVSFWEETKSSLIKRDYDYQRDFCELVDARIGNRAFSPSAINTYLKCPRQYFYNDILKLTAKSGNADLMYYGTSVHAACEFFVNYAKENGDYPSQDEFLNAFVKELNSLPLSDFNQRKVLEGRGIAALEQYYVQLKNTPISNMYATELPIEFEMEGVKFFGIIDRVDRNEDGSFSIYDYKTGNAKTNKIICPGGEHEDYYNQIGLYKLYFEKATGNAVKHTEFLFPEDFTKNLAVEFTEEECLAIEEKFKTAIANIKKYNFEPCYNPEICKYCSFKEYCSFEVL